MKFHVGNRNLKKSNQLNHAIFLKIDIVVSNESISNFCLQTGTLKMIICQQIIYIYIYVFFYGIFKKYKTLSWIPNNVAWKYLAATVHVSYKSEHFGSLSKLKDWLQIIANEWNIFSNFYIGKTSNNAFKHIVWLSLFHRQILFFFLCFKWILKRLIIKFIHIFKSTMNKLSTCLWAKQT